MGKELGFVAGSFFVVDPRCWPSHRVAMVADRSCAAALEDLSLGCSGRLLVRAPSRFLTVYEANSLRVLFRNVLGKSPGSIFSSLVLFYTPWDDTMGRV